MIGLKLIRKTRNLNQQKVALDLNISRESLSYYENGKREPSLQLLVDMSKYFNVSIDFLITGKEFNKNKPNIINILNFSITFYDFADFSFKKQQKKDAVFDIFFY